MPVTNIIEPQNGQVISTFSNQRSSRFCSDKILGCQVCVKATAIDGAAVLLITITLPFLDEPLEIESRITSDIRFTLDPDDLNGLASLVVEITNFTTDGDGLSFEFIGTLTVDLPIIGEKEFIFRKEFEVGSREDAFQRSAESATLNAMGLSALNVSNN